MRFNYTEKKYENNVFPKQIFFDKEQKMLPIEEKDGKYIQTFTIMSLPKYGLEYSRSTGYVILYEVKEFDYLSSFFELEEKAREKYEKMTKFLSEFVNMERVRRNKDEKYKFTPKENPTIEDFLISYAFELFN